MTSTGPSVAPKKKASGKKATTKASARRVAGQTEREIGRAIHRELKELQRLFRVVESEVRKTGRRAEQAGRQLTQRGPAKASVKKPAKKVTKRSPAKKATKKAAKTTGRG